MQTLERAVSEARRHQKNGEAAAEKASKQGRADREVLVECVRQMASQLATARAATEAANAQLLTSQAEASDRIRAVEDGVASEGARLQQMTAQLAECERQLQSEVERSQAASEASAATLRRAAQREAELEQQLAQAEEAAAAQDAALAASHRESEAQQAAARSAAREAAEFEACRRLEITSLQHELRSTEGQIEAAMHGEGAALSARERLSGSLVSLETEQANKIAQLAALQLEHSALQKAHEALAAEGAVRSKLVESLTATAQQIREAAATSGSALSADLANAEAMVRTLGDGRDTAVAELKAERVEHEACRLQLISAQAALQRVRADTSEVIATEGVRLTLALDELRRADRLAGVIHRSLHDAMRGAAESAGLLLPDAPGPQYAMKTAPALLPPPSTYGGGGYAGGGGMGGSALNSTSAVASSRNSTSGLSFAQTPITRRGGSPPPGSSRPQPGSTLGSARSGVGFNTGPTAPSALEVPSTSSSPTGSDRFRMMGGAPGTGMRGGGGGGGDPRLTPPFASAAGRMSPEARSTSTTGFGEGPHTGMRQHGGGGDELGDLASRRAAMLAGRDPTMLSGPAPGQQQGQQGGLDVRGTGLDVRGDGNTVGTGFAAASEALGWLRNDSHQERLRQLREKYGYEQQ